MTEENYRQKIEHANDRNHDLNRELSHLRGDLNSRVTQYEGEKRSLRYENDKLQRLIE